jgi:hypothetical protein
LVNWSQKENFLAFNTEEKFSFIKPTLLVNKGDEVFAPPDQQKSPKPISGPWLV